MVKWTENMLRYLSAILFIVLISGCTVGRGTGVFPPFADFTATPALSSDDSGSDYTFLVANGLSETITLVQRKNSEWTVTPDILETGQAPSFMAIRDNTCYLVNSLSNSIQMIDIDTLATTGEISTGPGTNPICLDFIDNTTAIVTCNLTDEAVLVDIASGTPPDERILARIELPGLDSLPHDNGAESYARPGGVAVVSDSAYIVCSNLSDYHVAGGPGVLVEVDLSGRVIKSTFILSGRDTTGILHSPRFPDRLIIMSAGDYDVADGFHGNGLVESLDLNSGEIFQSIPIDGAPFNGVVGPNDVIYMENGMESVVLRADLRNGVGLPSYPLPATGLSLSYASSIVALPGLVAVTDFNSDRMYLVDPIDGGILAQLASGDGPDAMVCVDFNN